MSKIQRNPNDARNAAIFAAIAIPFFVYLFATAKVVTPEERATRAAQEVALERKAEREDKAKAVAEAKVAYEKRAAEVKDVQDNLASWVKGCSGKGFTAAQQAQNCSTALLNVRYLVNTGIDDCEDKTGNLPDEGKALGCARAIVYRPLHDKLKTAIDKYNLLNPSRPYAVVVVIALK